MLDSLVTELKRWRREQARREAVKEYLVLPNVVLERIAEALPKDKEELCAIKGIKEAKYRKYGVTLLRIIKEYSSTSVILRETKGFEKVCGDATVRDSSALLQDENVPDPTLSVSQFLDGVNLELSGMAARVRGEVSSVDERERVVYFSLKDGTDESVLHCVVFRYQYDISGVQLAIGDEVVVEGVPEIYKPYGKFSLKVGVIELFGEGRLKKEYEALKQRLEAEGIFSPERKRRLPAYPKRIALVTSENGAAIGDFLANIGRNGFCVSLYPVSVEGKKSVFELLEALRYFRRRSKQYDVLVMIRGGGSLESLQAFNSESLTREIARLNLPTLLGIGHEKDIPLATLAADVAVSTPTAAARTLRHPFDEARQLADHFRFQLPILFHKYIAQTRYRIALDRTSLATNLHLLTERIRSLRQDLTERLVIIGASIRRFVDDATQAKQSLVRNFFSWLERVKREFVQCETQLALLDPRQILRLGYSIVRKSGRILRDASDVKVGDALGLQFSKGSVLARVEKIDNDELLS